MVFPILDISTKSFGKLFSIHLNTSIKLKFNRIDHYRLTKLNGMETTQGTYLNELLPCAFITVESIKSANSTPAHFKQNIILILFSVNHNVVESLN